MLLDLQSRLTALEQTMGAEKQTTEVLHGTVSALGRQMIAFEHRTAERVRSQGQSGGKQSSGGLWELKALREGKCRCHEGSQKQHGSISANLKKSEAIMPRLNFYSKYPRPET
ncbi:hypothetical protein DIPPA_04224 [Diplonema papillatum]|nr:hypothetical protein DIPPA_04224 [Diplonema papillatum]